jgi:hypothetical protein
VPLTQRISPTVTTLSNLAGARTDACGSVATKHCEAARGRCATDDGCPTGGRCPTGARTDVTVALRGAVVVTAIDGDRANDATVGMVVVCFFSNIVVGVYDVALRHGVGCLGMVPGVGAGGVCLQA